MIYASKQFCTFFDDSIHAELPSDAVAITAEYHAYLMEGQGEGKVISFETQPPTLIEYVAPEKTTEDYAAEERYWRNKELERADFKINAAVDNGDTTIETDWRSYRVALRGWPEHESFPNMHYRPVAPDRGN